MFNRVAVIGPGLLGGSVCKALKKNTPDLMISAFDRTTKNLKKVLEDGSADRVDVLDNFSPSEYQLIVVATPVVASLKIIRDIITAPGLSQDTLIIDVGSVKYEVINFIADCESSSQFIGCHPMAGSEKDGYDNSRADLYDGASVIITPVSKNKQSDIKKIKKFWELLGADTSIVTAELHDLIVSYTSHLPHLVACSLADLMQKYSKNMDFDEQIMPFIGDGFRDMTRISAGSPEMWQDIILLNKKNIENSIYELIKGLEGLLNIVKNENAGSGISHKYLQEIKKFRDGIK